MLELLFLVLLFFFFLKLNLSTRYLNFLNLSEFARNYNIVHIPQNFAILIGSTNIIQQNIYRTTRNGNNDS